MLFSLRPAAGYKDHGDWDCHAEERIMTKNGAVQPLVSVDELAEHLDDPHWIIVDCRFNLLRPDAGRQAYAAGHIPGAFYADLDNDLASAASAESGGRHPLPEAVSLGRLFASWGVGVDSMVVVYDDVGGAFAARLWWLFKWMGHARVALLDGDLRAWQAANYASGTARSESRRVYGTPGHMPVIDVNELETGLADDSLLLLDARTPDRFAGKQEPLDRVAGHVPGALNLPYQDNLRLDGFFHAGHALRAQYEPHIGARPPSELVCMCGSGVTACHTLLALELAGIKGASLYVGSWSDWVSSAQRPVATE
jgi:thiosulfate/3-mercaptopyruvate sulfurtransferase